jgi:hypothetical protein
MACSEMFSMKSHHFHTFFEQKSFVWYVALDVFGHQVVKIHPKKKNTEDDV